MCKSPLESLIFVTLSSISSTTPVLSSSVTISPTLYWFSKTIKAPDITSLIKLCEAKPTARPPIPAAANTDCRFSAFVRSVKIATPERIYTVYLNTLTKSVDMVSILLSSSLCLNDFCFSMAFLIILLPNFDSKTLMTNTAIIFTIKTNGLYSPPRIIFKFPGIFVIHSIMSTMSRIIPILLYTHNKHIFYIF